MFIMILVVVLFVLYKLGFLRRTKACSCCGKQLKGNKQIICNNEDKSEKFVVCKDCFDKIPGSLTYNFQYKWGKDCFVNYCNWFDGFEEQRKIFRPTLECGTLKIDVENKLFSVGEAIPQKAIYSFNSVFTHDFSCDVDEKKAKQIGRKHTDLYINMFYFLGNPCINDNICIKVTTCSVEKSGFLNKKRNYEFEHGEGYVLQMFSALVYEAQHKNDKNVVELDELQKALALFMFDSLSDLTAEDIKAQRNTLIKAFHPDNVDSDASYSQKINEAYEVLMKAVS